MNNIWWQTKGQGNVHLVLLHGWGLNAEVWRCIDEELPLFARSDRRERSTTPAPALTRRYSFSPAGFYRWRHYWRQG